MHLTRATVAVLGSLVLSLGLAGCEPAVSPIEQAAGSIAAVGRAATTDALEVAFLESDITFEACLEAAEAQLAAGEPTASEFAGAVLDLAARIEDRFPTGPEYELFWFRMGQLAGKATAAAMQAGRFDEAATLVLAGPKRWQRMGYWHRYPNHDIMVALSMAQQGRFGEATSRLQSRPIQTPEMEAAVGQIRELQRQVLRERLREKVEAEEAQNAGG
ncbi:MAG: hypothetical protein AAFN41_14380 [Planctomycetota bacterium]